MEVALTKPAAHVPAGKREQTKVQNRQMILEAARGVFAEMGYGAATVRDIIRATPLASGTFYNYFQSKDELAAALLDCIIHDLARRNFHATVGIAGRALHALMPVNVFEINPQSKTSGGKCTCGKPDCQAGVFPVFYLWLQAL